MLLAKLKNIGEIEQNFSVKTSLSKFAD